MFTEVSLFRNIYAALKNFRLRPMCIASIIFGAYLVLPTIRFPTVLKKLIENNCNSEVFVFIVNLDH